MRESAIAASASIGESSRRLGGDAVVAPKGISAGDHRRMPTGHLHLQRYDFQWSLTLGGKV